MSRALIQVYLANADAADSQTATDAAVRLAQGLRSNEYSLIGVITELGEFLNDDRADLRRRAVGVLAAVLAALPSDWLPEVHTPVVCRFFCDRLADGDCLGPLLRGLDALRTMPGFDAEPVCTSIFSALDMKAQPQDVRGLVYKLIGAFVADSKQEEDLRQINDTFVKGFVDLMIGEKDPRNLLLCFDIIRHILTHFSIDGFVQDLFETTFCYFPITFRSKPDDPSGITADELKLSLRSCISANKLFAPFAFPSLLNKLSSTSVAVKVDILLTVIACVQNYGPGVVDSHASSIWEHVKFEVLQPSDDEVAENALATLIAVARSLSVDSDLTTGGDSLARFLNLAIEEGENQPKEPTNKQLKCAGQILARCASASYCANHIIVKTVLPRLIEFLKDPNSNAIVDVFLNTLNEFISAAISVFDEDGESHETRSCIDENPLLTFREELLSLYIDHLHSDSIVTKELSLKGIMLLTRLRSYLTDHQLRSCVNLYNNIILNQKSNNQFSLPALDILARLAATRPQLILELTFPALLAQLPDTNPDLSELLWYRYILACLGDLSMQRDVFQSLILRLFSKVKRTVLSASCAAYPYSLLVTILYVLQKRLSYKIDDLNYLIDDILPPLFTCILSSPWSPSLQEQEMDSQKLFRVAATIANILIRSVSVEQQTRLLNGICAYFLRNESVEGFGLLSNKQFEPFDYNAPPPIANGTFLLFTTIAGKRRETVLAISDFELASGLRHLALASQHCLQREGALKLLGCIVNKWDESDSQLEPFLRETVSVVLQQVVQNESKSDRIRNLELAFWLGKGLLMRAHSMGFGILGELCELLNDREIGSIVARGFRLLICEDDLLCKSNHATQKLLYKQRAFDILYKNVLGKLKQSNHEPYRTNAHIALAIFLGNTPNRIFISELSQLLPCLLLLINNASCADIWEEVIHLLYIAILEAPQETVKHLSTLVAALLARSLPGQSSLGQEQEMAVRLAALRALQRVPSTCRHDQIHPLVLSVIRKLGELLDDPKRALRRQVVDTRHAWYMSK